MSEKCCNQDMKLEQYTLEPHKDYQYRDIIVYTCSQCTHQRMYKEFLDKKGDKFKRFIHGRKFVQENLEELQGKLRQIFIEQFPLRDNWAFGKTQYRETEAGTEIQHTSFYFNTGKKRQLEYSGIGKLKELAL